jgi:Tol biopolymer transport system component
MMKLARLLVTRLMTAGTVALLALIATASSAYATYPGKVNGRLAFAITLDGNTDIYSVLPNGEALHRLTDDPGFDACPAYSADGNWIAWCGPGGIWTMKQNGTEKRQLTTFGAFPDFSPDGSKVVFGGAPPGSANLDVWVVDADGGHLTRLTTAPGFDRMPAWSPDGTKILFQSSRTGIGQVWVMNADGSGQTQLTFDSVAKDQLPDWSPDGSQIAFVTQTHASGGDIWLMNADGSNAHAITSGADKLGTAWSPDGTKIATLDWLSRTVEVMNADGSDAYAVHTAGVQFVPGWQPRGTGVIHRGVRVPATKVVDRDGVDCANAGFTSIQAAVDAAEPGDLIRVCPDLYAETVVVDKPLTLKADPDAVEAMNCFQPTLGELPAEQQAIIDPAGDGFSIAFKLEADHVELAGFVVHGATVGIDASDRFSGYRIHHNLIHSNTLFGVDFGSEGTRESRVDHNCIRENPYGLVSELDDDSLWKGSDGPERDPWNARDLRSALIDHNAAFRNGVGGLEAAGPGLREQVTFDHNAVREGIIGIAIQNATRSAITDNEIMSPTFASIFLGGGNDGLEVDSNIARGGGTGIAFAAANFIDRFPVPSRDLVVSRNDIAGGAAAGILATAGNLADSDILGNTISGKLGSGINLLSGNTGNDVRGNHSDNNGINGIVAQVGATRNRFEQNSMHGNALFDARDANPRLNDVLQNVWTGNDCDTDFPAGLICGIG